MSDFDKEAEREKLREKYERDQENREATQRMSDLLLKGATMTNTHCNTCGDPLFRMNGTTFCPTCHGDPEAVEGTALEGGQSAEGEQSANAGQPANAGQSASAGQSTEAGQATNAGDVRPRSDAGQTGADAAPDASNADPSTADAAQNQGAATRADDGGRSGRASPSTNRSAGGSSASPTDESAIASRTPGETAPSGPSEPVDGDLESARGSLRRALERFAREAAETDDPRYARECLEASQEAADALAALRRGS